MQESYIIPALHKLMGGVELKEIITVHQVKKSYHKKIVLEKISFQVREGEFLTLLGPNGAGKSTLINILCGTARADEGRVSIAGYIQTGKRKEIAAKMGMVFQQSVLDDLLTVEENLLSRGRFYGLKGKELKERIWEMAQMTGITTLMEQSYGKLSGGQRRRCDMARALLHRPRILLLDEPTVGLDPEIRNEVWKTIENIRKARGMTLILTTHYMEEALRAERIMLLNKGRIIAQGTPYELKKEFSQDTLYLFSGNIPSLKRILEYKGIRGKEKGGGFEVPLSSTLEALPLLELCKGRYWGFEVRQGSMETAYLNILNLSERQMLKFGEKTF